MSALSAVTYDESENEEIRRWESTAAQLGDSLSAQDKSLHALNTHLSTRTTVLGHKPSAADTALYRILAPQVAQWTIEQRTGEHGFVHIVRHCDFVQKSKLFGLELSAAEQVQIDANKVLYFKPPFDPRAEKERVKKAKAAAAAAAVTPQNDPQASSRLAVRSSETGNGSLSKKDRAEQELSAAKHSVGGTVDTKQKKANKSPAVPMQLSPSLIDLRVGHILKAIKHPEADSLYVSTIAMGDMPGTEDTELVDGLVTRTVCSGLNGLVPLEDMQGRRVVVVANLKPVKMRGIKSCAMVLAASPRLAEGEMDNHAGPVELVAPPSGAETGQKVFFEDWQGEPEGILNPKKKIWETIQPGFTTTDDLHVAFDAAVVKDLHKEGEGAKTSIAKLVDSKGDVCTVQSLKHAVVR